ncbi:hypothetical protein LTR08_005037 [Meristemomyces frigidus]|nr:hypothetical protein LTR08_005037 [Meristemomyces frigidus]
MAYTPEAVTSKLASLTETQDSIVACAQWLLFHRRHAPTTAALWLSRLKLAPSPAKKLNLLYLANEVVQQSRARGKQDFLLAFEPLVAEATSVAYGGGSLDVQGKVRRVVEVWRQRGIFGPGTLAGVEARLAELDRSLSSKGAGKLGGALFASGSVGGALPLDIEGVARCQVLVCRAEAVAKGGVVEAAEKEWGRMMDGNAVLPSPPVHAARLSALMRNLETAQGAVEASVLARSALVAELERLVGVNRGKWEVEVAVAGGLRAKKEGVEVRKKEVEDGIMRGLSAPTSPRAGNSPVGGAVRGGTDDGGEEVDGPEVEGFTPPAGEGRGSTPVGDEDGNGADVVVEGNVGGVDAGRSGGYADVDPHAALAEPASAGPPPPPPPTDQPGMPSSEPHPPPPAPLLSATTPTAPPPTTTSPTPARAAAQAFLDNFHPAPPGPAFPSAAFPSANPTTTRQASFSSAAAESPGDPRLKRRKLGHRGSAEAREDDVFAGRGGLELGVDEEGVGAMLGD